jgi:SMI1 / KNR4 family (SUKH-1)
MAEKVVKLGRPRDAAFLYYLREGAVWRLARKAQDPRPEKVADVSFEMDPAYKYFVDSDGDVARTPDPGGAAGSSKPVTTKPTTKGRVKSRSAPVGAAKKLPAMNTFLKRLRQKVRELEARKDVVLLNWDVGKPASADAIARVEKHLGFPLPESIRDIYRQADGLSLRWIHRDNPVFDPKKHRRVKGRLVPGFVMKKRLPEGFSVIDNSGADDGCICLLPIRETFIDADWGELVYFDWMTDKEKSDQGSYGLLSFSRSLRIFDFFSYYEMAAVLTLEKSLPVIVGTDHGADWTGSAGDFQSYWEFVLAHYGSVQARSEAFVTRSAGDGTPHTGGPAPALGDVFETCRRGWA